MTTHHPDLAAEQAYIDHAYACLERSPAGRLPDAGAHRGGAGRHPPGPLRAGRLRRGHLSAGSPSSTSRDAALVFGRIDRRRRRHAGRRSSRSVESFHIGRLAVADEEREPVVIDWRAPVAEPFYRATGRDPMGLARRRHFSVRGRQLLDIEDELFGAGPPRHRHDIEDDGARFGAARLQHADRRPRAGPHRPARRHRRHDPGRAGRDHPLARRPACSSCRAGRAPARPSWRSTAPPTSSTRTASRWRTRACWSSGPTGCSCATSSGCCRRSARPASSRSCSADLVPDVALRRPPTRRSRPGSRATPAWPTSSAKAVRDRERPLREDARRAVRPHRTCALRCAETRARSCRRPGAASAATTPAAGSSRARCSPRWPPVGRERARRPTTVRDRARAHRRGARRARADVAGAHAGPAAPRPVRLAGAAAPGRRQVADRRRARLALPAPRRRRRRRALVARPTPPCSTRPASCSGPAPARATAPARRDADGRPTRSAPTATSSSTRCRTSRRCSCAWRRAAR